MLLREQELDILKNFNKTDYRRVRDIIIKMVLATDMANHANNSNALKSIAEQISQKENDVGQSNN